VVYLREISPSIVNAALKQLRGPLGNVKTKSAVFTMFRSLVLATQVRERVFVCVCVCMRVVFVVCVCVCLCL
jgi:hypothetical protein